MSGRAPASGSEGDNRGWDVRFGSALAVSFLVLVIGCGGGGGGGKPPGPELTYPSVIESENGVLRTTLTIEAATQTVAGEDITFPELYNGLYTPPTLHVQPGDQIELRLRNFGYQSTNFHYHGLGVTPMGAGDNVFLELEAGLTFDYSFPIPADQDQGMFWYHPHLDPMLNTQLSGGMAGALIVGDILAPFPQLQGIPERIMILKDLKTVDGFPMPDPAPAGPTKRTINGVYQPRITMQPGQLEFWRIGNFSSNIYIRAVARGADVQRHRRGRQPAEPGHPDRHPGDAAGQAARAADLRAGEGQLQAAHGGLRHGSAG